jgi:hypothetical protein
MLKVAPLHLALPEADETVDAAIRIAVLTIKGTKSRFVVRRLSRCTTVQN